MIFPYFTYGCGNLEMNVQRTAAYLASAGATCGDDLKSYFDMKCECGPLFYAFDEDDVPAVAVYSTPAGDNAPWYDASIPESAQFLGFMIEEVTQNVVTSRTVTTRISSSGGGVLGPRRNKERRLDFTVLLFACNEAAMEYGFRYLNDALNSPGCDGACTLCECEFRDSCPEVDGTWESLQKGRWLLKNVGAVDGPTWDAHPMPGSTCNLRRVRFSLASELPWKYKCPIEECSGTFVGEPDLGVDCVDFDQWLCGENEITCAISEDLIIGETGLIIDIQAGSVPLQHIKIKVRPDQFGYECAPETRPPGYTRVDPCDEIVIPYLPASYRLVYDTSIEEIKLHTPGGGIYEGIGYVSTQTGRPPTFPTLRCGSFCVSISASECSVVGDPTVTIKSVHREI